jgi:23S rRNA pseudouridine1911/1915/1917 synthase
MSNLDISRAQRLDQYVIAVLPQLSRGAATQLIKDGKVRVNGEPAAKAGYKLRTNDRIDIDFNHDDYERTPDIEVPILYEDNDCLVMSKPAGLLTHSKGAFNPEPTVASFLRARLQSQKTQQYHNFTHYEDEDYPYNIGKDGVVSLRAGIVHRLDRATSGVIICAKTGAAHKWLQKQFSSRKVRKTYIAIVDGHMKESHAIIDMPIERNPKKPQVFRAGANGKHAITEYYVQQSNTSYEVLKLTPQTGRTHQLRVHLSQLGHPIVGDPLYCGSGAARLFLHALSLEITLPNRERRIFESSLPEEFHQFINAESHV